MQTQVCRDQEEVLATGAVEAENDGGGLGMKIRSGLGAVPVMLTLSAVASAAASGTLLIEQ